MRRFPIQPLGALGPGLALLLLAGCSDAAAPDDALDPARAGEVARIRPAQEALAGAHVPTLDPARLEDAEIAKALGGGPACLFRYTSGGRPVLAVAAGAAQQPGAGEAAEQPGAVGAADQFEAGGGAPQTGPDGAAQQAGVGAAAQQPDADGAVQQPGADGAVLQPGADGPALPGAGGSAARAGPAGAERQPGEAVIKLNGDLVLLRAQAADAGVTLSAGPVRMSVAPLEGPKDGQREATAVFEISDSLRVGYRGYWNCNAPTRSPATS